MPYWFWSATFVRKDIKILKMVIKFMIRFYTAVKVLGHRDTSLQGLQAADQMWLTVQQPASLFIDIVNCIIFTRGIHLTAQRTPCMRSWISIWIMGWPWIMWWLNTANINLVPPTTSQMYKENRILISVGCLGQVWHWRAFFNQLCLMLFTNKNTAKLFSGFTAKMGLL